MAVHDVVCVYEQVTAASSLAELEPDKATSSETDLLETHSHFQRYLLNIYLLTFAEAQKHNGMRAMEARNLSFDIDFVFSVSTMSRRYYIEQCKRLTLRRSKLSVFVNRDMQPSNRSLAIDTAT